MIHSITSCLVNHYKHNWFNLVQIHLYINNLSSYSTVKWFFDNSISQSHNFLLEVCNAFSWVQFYKGCQLELGMRKLVLFLDTNFSVTLPWNKSRHIMLQWRYNFNIATPYYRNYTKSRRLWCPMPNLFLLGEF